MREILFRGKRVDNGEWAYGDLLTCDDEMEIYSESHGENGGWVIPETVGEYTGLTDKNGVKIFEGDIVKYSQSLHEVVFCSRFGNAFFGIDFPERGEIWAFSPSVDAERMTVIGNIYDNPELIEDMDIKPAAKMSDTPAEQLGLAPAT